MTSSGSGGSGGAATSAGAGGDGGGGAGGGGALDAAARLAQVLTGRFDSSAQAAADPNYFAVQLLTCRIDVPDLGERVLYIEQAIVGNLDAPYRQRLYVIEPLADPTSQARSRVFELGDPAAFVGLCDDPSPMTVVAGDAIEKPGCAVEVTWMAEHFEGGTVGEACLSDFQGATYTTSVVSISAEKIESWDRGWDAADMQVWGALGGPYVFDRKTPLPEE
jgi:CpeT protein